MKTRDIENILKNRGFESGTLYILQALNEENRTLRKSVTEMAQLLNHMVDTMQNVVNGVHGMRNEQIKALKKAGVLMDDTVASEMGPNTQDIN